MIYTIRQYEEISRWVDSFSAGSFNIMCIIGAAGQSKSTQVLNAINSEDRVYLKGSNVTAFHLYKTLYLNRDKTFILDDIDSIFHDKPLVRLLKAVTETEKVKQIDWNSSAKSLDAEDIPRSFKTKSRVIVIVNRMTEDFGEHLGSLIDRGICLKFKPSSKTVLEYGKKTFFKDKEIIKFVEEQLDLFGDLIQDFSLRVLSTALEARNAGLDWKSAVLETLNIKEISIAHSLMKNRTYPVDTHRAMEFMRLTGLSQPMYYKYRAKIEEMMGKPKRQSHRKAALPKESKRQLLMA